MYVAADMKGGFFEGPKAVLARAVGQETESSTSAKHVKPPSRTVFAALIPMLNVCSRHSSAGESRGLHASYSRHVLL